MTLRRLVLSDAPATARVHRASFDDRLPWLAGLHTGEEDQHYFANVVFDECEVWGAFDGDTLIGFIAFRDRFIDQLYVLPNYQGCGVGGGLLAVAQSQSIELQLWTFQKNCSARRFYEKKGFLTAEQTDGSRNDEREPDIRYVWRQKA